MNILVFTAYYLPGYKGGGPIKTIKNLLHETGMEINYCLVAKDRDFGDTVPYVSIQPGEWNQVKNTPAFYTQPGYRGGLQIWNLLRARNYDCIYLNSFFSVRFSFIPLLMAKILGQKVVLGPRGEFSEGALSLKEARKKLFIQMYKLMRLHNGVVFQASSSFEAEDIRRTLGDGVDIKIAEDIGSQEFVGAVMPKNRSSLRAVFISRISPKKNLLGAIEMLATVRGNVIYDIYGPIEDHQYWERCREKIEMLPANIEVNYKGPLSPQEVVATISSYDVFFMPTKGENYGHVIAEALCAGLPLLIADTTPWRGLHDKGLGWDLPLAHPQAFVNVLDELAAMSLENHLQMRKNVLAWAKRKFSQRDAIEANIAMFRYAYEQKK